MDKMSKYADAIALGLIVASVVLIFAGHDLWAWLTWATTGFNYAVEKDRQPGGWIYEYQTLIGGGLALYGAYLAVVRPMQTEQKKRENRKAGFRIHLGEVFGYVVQSEKIIFSNNQESIDVIQSNKNTIIVLLELSKAIARYLDIYNSLMMVLIDDDYMDYSHILQINMLLRSLEDKAETIAGKLSLNLSIEGGYVDAYNMLEDNLREAKERISSFLENTEAEASVLTET